MNKKMIIISVITVVFFFFAFNLIDNQFFVGPGLKTPHIEISPIPERTIESVTLYFSNLTRDRLVKEMRRIERFNQSKEELILRELIKGPKGDNMYPTIPPRTRIYSVITVDGITYINFSKEFETNHIGGEYAEATTIFSIVNSLTELDHVNKVKITIDGERPEFYKLHMSLKEPFSRNENIVRGTLSTPMEVLRMYFDYIENEEYRRAYNLLYRPLQSNLDFATFYHLIRKNVGEVREFNINKYTIFWEPGLITIILDYEEIREEEINYFNDVKFRLRNYFGEWRIIFDE